MAKKASRTTNSKKTVETLRHADSRRTNIPTAEQQSVMETEEKYSIQVAYERRNRDLDPQLVWRGKDEQDAGPLVANAPPLYIQEKVHPKVLIDDLMRRTDDLKEKGKYKQLDLFGDFNGLPEEARSAEFYQHEANWTNRMILGDSLQVMASLAEREGLRGKVQCIYFDPPYGIKFNSNFQWSTRTQDVKDGKVDHITREPEQVKAFRDTWTQGIHSYLAYISQRLVAMRELLSETGSIFIQIGEENVHRIRCVLDEVFGEENFVSQCTVRKTTSDSSVLIGATCDYVLWFAKCKIRAKGRKIYSPRSEEAESRYASIDRVTGKRMQLDNITSSRPSGAGDVKSFNLFGHNFTPGKGTFKTTEKGLRLLSKADRLSVTGNGKLRYRRYADDFGYTPIANLWTDISGAVQSRADPKVYVVQTSTSIVQRCLLMASDPGDLVLDPTCGSGTTAYVAENLGRRWITIDTSRVALALARARVIGSKFPFFLLRDSKEGVDKESGFNRTSHESASMGGDLRQGFVCESVPRVMLSTIANNAEIDVIYDAFQAKLEPIREQLNTLLGESWEEWQIPREPGQRWEDDAVVLHASLIEQRRRLASTLEVLDTVELSQHAEKVREIIAAEAAAEVKKLNGLVGMKGKDAFTLDTLPEEPRDPWPDDAKKLHAKWWKLRIERQKDIDASIAAKADFEYLYDKPYEDKTKVRVAGPFTVESLSPHRTLAVGADDELIDPLDLNPTRQRGTATTDREVADFATMVLDNLKKSGVQQAHKEDKIDFTSLVPWPGDYIAAEGRFNDASGKEQRAGIFIGPEFGTISQPDLKAAARECGDAGFDVLISCGFNYEAHATEFNKLGRIQVLKARMNADMHMSADLKNTGKGNLFVIFGEPDVEVVSGQWLVTSKGRQVCSYEQCKKLSGLAGLAEINGVGGSDLQGFQDVSAGRAIWADQSDSSGGSFDSIEHSGGSGKNGDRRVPAVSKSRKRLAGGDRDTTHAGRKVAVPLKRDSKSTSDASRGNQPHDRWTEAITQIDKLSEADFPLSLATNHLTQVTIHGVDVFQPSTGEVRSDGADGIACWFIDTDYNEESFFVRQAYFLGANDPYKSLKTTLKAEIDKEAWDSLNSDTSRPFPQPKSGRIAVKVINHLGDEVMKVFRVKEEL
jgi:adenine-specific DNA-methyltransferase